MGTLVQQIAEKYQGSAPQRIIHAVEKAAARTGADFALLMQKAAAESSFNPAAKSSTSSATGLFQFIDSTWLGLVKEHGAKYGLGAYANHIDMKNGRPCVTDCKVRDAILNLRKNPEISALMAGEMTAENKQYLEAHTDGTVGSTEMYLAHFLGAGGAAKFLNSRDENGDMTAAKLFPKEAHANRSIFFNAATGHARTLNEVYSLFARKVGDDASTQVAQNSNTTGTTARPVVASATTAPASAATPSLPLSHCMPLMQTLMAQALPSSSDDAAMEGRSGFAHGSLFPAGSKLSAENVMLLAQMQRHAADGLRTDNKPHYNA